MQDLGVGVIDMELESLAPQEKDPFLVIPLEGGSLQVGCGLFPGSPYFSLSYASQCCPFTLCCGEFFLQISGIFSKGAIVYLVVALLCQCEEMNFGSSYAIILKLLQKPHIV